jgi:hypothetical protein
VHVLLREERDSEEEAGKMEEEVEEKKEARVQPDGTTGTTWVAKCP